MTQSQKHFKEFAALWRYNLAQDDNGFYVDSLTQRVWDAWQESRASMVVELPCWSEYDTTRQCMDATKQQLDEVGVKYK